MILSVPVLAQKVSESVGKVKMNLQKWWMCYEISGVVGAVDFGASRPSWEVQLGAISRLRLAGFSQ